MCSSMRDCLRTGVLETQEQLEALSQAPLRVEPLCLTSALDQLRQEHGLEGVVLQGERYDIGGDPHTYLRTLNALAPPASEV